jgi:hypothetical protein
VLRPQKLSCTASLPRSSRQCREHVSRVQQLADRAGASAAAVVARVVPTTWARSAHARIRPADTPAHAHTSTPSGSVTDSSPGGRSPRRSWPGSPSPRTVRRSYSWVSRPIRDRSPNEHRRLDDAVPHDELAIRAPDRVGPPRPRRLSCAQGRPAPRPAVGGPQPGHDPRSLVTLVVTAQASCQDPGLLPRRRDETARPSSVLGAVPDGVDTLVGHCCERVVDDDATTDEQACRLGQRRRGARSGGDDEEVGAAGTRCPAAGPRR